MYQPTDAIGFLINLREQVNQPWFTYLCDQAIATSDGELTETQIDMVANILKGNVDYSSPINVPQPDIQNVNSDDTQPSVTHLKELHSFSNFKRIDRNLKLTLNKRVTIIFGANGTGKSSLCSALKILTMPKEPDTPIENVLAPTSHETSFVYKISNQPDGIFWNKSIGYGTFYNHVKYFDSSIALNMLNSTISTEIVSEVTPFKLEVFIHLNSMLNKFKSNLDQEITTLQALLDSNLKMIKIRLQKFGRSENEMIEKLDITDIPTLKKMLESKKSTADDVIAENESKLQSMLQSLSPEGLQLLVNEHKDYKNFLEKLILFFNMASDLIYDNIPIAVSQLNEKSAAQKELLNRYVNQDQEVADFKKFIQSSLVVFNHKHEDGEKCPYCKQILSPEAHQLIDSYKVFLTNELETEVNYLQRDISNFEDLKLKISRFDTSFVVSPSASIDPSLAQEAKMIIESVIEEASLDLVSIEEKNISGYYKFKELQSLIELVKERISQLDGIIESSKRDQETVKIQIGELKNRIKEMQFANELIALSPFILSLDDRFNYFKELETKITRINFTTLSRRITDFSKKAYSELVLTEFQQRLDDEYYSLSEKRARDFGVTLTTRSNRAVVELEPQIGNHIVKKVLSEGEQKVHALALFFTESYYENKNIVVFDDPVTSLDYNYVASFSERIRDFVIDHPSKQIIIFTHDWYFLKDLQKTFNDAGFNQQTYNVQILEDCTTISENIEAIDKLKQKIESILSSTDPFDQGQKDMIAKHLRRLIEAVINVHVFNETRTQFKRDNIKVSVFSEYTKLTPLFAQEANKLRDLYKKLSPWEHDDPRSHFMNSDKAVFQSRYDEICGVEASILSRK